MNDEIKEILDNFIKYKDNWYSCEYILKPKQCVLLLDYITKLQEDIRTGQEINSELQQENERLKEIWKDTIVFSKDYETIVMNTNGYKFYNDYKSRCEKAIEYINTHDDSFYQEKGLNEDSLNNLLNILQNGSDSQ